MPASDDIFEFHSPISTLRAAAIHGREDISQFVVHLTRNDSDDFTNGATARDNFIAIIRSKQILSVRPHCLFNKRIKKFSKEVQDEFGVACFTEVPLNQLHLLVRDIPGRSVKFEPYGFVFRKEFIVSAGGQPAIYVNSYGGNMWLREAVDALFDAACVDGKLDPKLSRLLPFINAMHEGYDFSWEREWRIRNGLKFKRDDLVCVILPSDKDDDLKEKFAKGGLAVISPGWTYEQIVTELAKQQKATKDLASLAGGSIVPPQKNEKSNTAQAAA